MPGLFAAIALFIKQLSLLVSYVKNNAFPQPLQEDEEARHIQLMANGDQKSRNLLIEHNLRLVAHVVKKFDNSKEDTEDLISIGTIGLIKAIESYSPDKGTKLATFAARCIENEILMHFRSKKKSSKDISLNDPIGTDKEGNEISLIDILGTEQDEVLEKVQLSIEKSKIYRNLDILDAREREVVVARFGLETGGEERTQREIAKDLGISRSYVSRIEKRALMKLYHEFYKAKR
ncbi:RNA polymerase sporulation sigma factor SigK [Paenibacillus sp. CF384]|uniref:RNA polymerase sporulation sigma factor SigK n=1 Tax=Paenibacillus sp. CF384 TaxID=1884382 RepID=UPI00089A1B81|nr:RNA polymerase sporulation sigma factor SigK [Paenibacillus sp. CF384]SDW91188.1 RNA polymerase, sigma 27/28 subunit, RpsK/SigK [Paenibacillus sp. CF384]